MLCVLRVFCGVVVVWCVCCVCCVAGVCCVCCGVERGVWRVARGAWDVGCGMCCVCCVCCVENRGTDLVDDAEDQVVTSINVRTNTHQKHS